jgi:hypothetical protein
VFKFHFSVMVLCACLLGFECRQVEAMEQSAETSSEHLQPAHTVTGILTTLDRSAGNGILKTDLNKPIFFKISRPDLFEHLSIGDRVTMQIDDEGRTMKVIKALPAEVHEPPPPSSQ